MISEVEQEILLGDFPNIELSYETMVHKKVYDADLVLAVPEGKKCFAWFTVLRTQNVCVIMEISDNKELCGFKIVHSCFENKLSYGTIFYGTVFPYEDAQFFSIEDVLYYKGNNVSSLNYIEKLSMLSNIFQNELKQIALVPNSSVVFGLPIIVEGFNEMIQTAPLLPYKVKYIQFRQMNKQGGNQVFNLLYSKPTYGSTVNIFLNVKGGCGPSNISSQPSIAPGLEDKELIFKVKPDLLNDIYHLYTLKYNAKTNTMEDYYFDMAYIPDYVTSKMMNRLFRTIKENDNLDALEESDDEEEFENDRIDKFVFLDREYNMMCLYNKKFKRWVPVRLANSGANENVIRHENLHCK
jgi:hypothetical protein